MLAYNHDHVGFPPEHGSTGSSGIGGAPRPKSRPFRVELYHQAGQTVAVAALVCREASANSPTNNVTFPMQTTHVSDKIAGRALLEKEVVRVGGKGWNVDFTIDDEASLQQVEDGLRRYLTESRGWFDGAPINVNVGRRRLTLEDLSRLRRLFEDEFRIKVGSLRGDDPTLDRALSEEALALAALIAGPGVLPPAQPQRQQPQSGAPLLIKGTCRSGMDVRHDGDVIIHGDLNPGAQVTATGDVIVLGTLRGLAHAGFEHVDGVGPSIIALSLRPLQLRIGPHVSVAPAERKGKRQSKQPEIAYVKGTSIVVASYSGGPWKS